MTGTLATRLVTAIHDEAHSDYWVAASTMTGMVMGAVGMMAGTMVTNEKCSRIIQTGFHNYNRSAGRPLATIAV